MSKPFKSGFVGLVGRYNTGKSTLLNAVLGEKLAIISPTPQTTRDRILGVLNRENSQLAFLDSPGSHDPKHALGRMMVEALKSVLADADVLILMIDAQRGIQSEDQRVIQRVRESEKPVICAINKSDAVAKSKILPIIQRCAELQLFEEIIPISAKNGEQLDLLLDSIESLLPEGPVLFEGGRITDQSETARIRELIREPILHAAKQEVPHAVGILLDLMEDSDESPQGRFTIHATILVERAGQRAILLGHKGKCIKHIGMQARKSIEKLLGKKIYLNLWVKVAPDWRKDTFILKELGYS